MSYLPHALLVLSLFVAAPSAQTRAPVADPSTHALIATAMGATESGTRRSALQELTALARRDERGLVRQLFLFSHTAQTTRDAMAFGVLRGPTGLSTDAIVRALVPLLAQPDEAMQRGVAGTLTEFENRTPTQGPDFTVYGPLLKLPLDRKSATNAALVQHLFKTGPSAALTLFERLASAPTAKSSVFESVDQSLREWHRRQRLGLDTQAARSTVLSHIDGMRHHKQWWARAFAAAVLTTEAELGQPSWIAALKLDKDRFVRNAAR